MQIVDKYEDNGALFYTVELKANVFVDVKCDMDLCYVMDCEDGCKAYDNNGNTLDYSFNEDEVIEYVKHSNHIK